MTRQHRSHERFIEEVVRRVTGALVEHVDDGSVDGLYDARLTYPDGRAAALEMTTLVEPAAMEMLSFPTKLEVPETPHWWDLRYPKGRVSRREIERHIPALVRWLDELDLDDAQEVEDWMKVTPEWEWYDRTGLRLRRYSGASQGGRVDVLPDSFGGVVDSGLDGLADWVEALQEEPWWRENVAKVARSGYDELHLGLRLHESKVPFGIFAGLWNPEEVKSRQPTGMEPLTDLWLIIGYGNTVTRWSAGSGWSVHVYNESN